MNVELTAEDVLGLWLDTDAPDATDPVLLNLIKYTKAIIAYEFPTLDERIALGTIPEDVAKMVAIGVVLRAHKLGIEYRSAYSEGTGPFTHSASFAGGGEDARRLIFLTDHERDLLKPKNPNKGSKVFTVSMGPATYGPYSTAWEQYL